MCGIAGIVAFPGAPPPEAPAVQRMCATLAHRGPDDAGIEVRGAVGLAMQRLSIIDVEGGHQPIHNEDRSVRTVYNGEIYNFRELRAHLEARGHAFRTHADTEVIVHAWEEDGADLVRRLNGMFAIALHDATRRRFLLARDRLGIKPLYWTVADGRLVFGSEIKALLASGLMAPRLDVDALGQFLAWEYVPGAATLLRNVHQLEPGSLLEIDLDDPRPEPRRWWDVPVPARDAATGGGRAGRSGARRDGPEAAGRTGDGDGTGSGGPQTAADWADAVDTKLRECVRRQLVSDVPLGAFLSGGVDSSLMVASMGADARTFSIGFDDPSYNELQWARRVADHLGVDHRDEIIRPDVVELFEHLAGFLDDPIGDFSIFPTYLVSRLARRHVKVVLSGDGGDEIFGGYETHVAQRMARRWGAVPGPLRRLAEGRIAALRPRPEKKGLVNKARRFVEGLGHDPRLGHARWRVFAGEAARLRLFTPEAADTLTTPVGAHILELLERAGDRPELDRALYVDLGSYLSDNILVKVDRMSMACSLEARVPYLDHELVELAFRMPPELKVDGRRTKVLLKEVAARHVPRECVERPKEGFSIPIKHWLGAEFRPLMEELLAPDAVAADGLFRVDEVERLKSEHLAGRDNHSHLLWSLLVFQDWRKRWGVSLG